MNRTHAQSLVREMGAGLGLDGLALDADDHCLLQVGERVELSIEYDGEAHALVLTATGGRLPEAARERASLALLEANHYWTGAGGATLSCDPHNGTVYLQVREPADTLDSARLAGLVQALVGNAEYWHERLLHLASADAAEPAPLHPHFTRV